MGFCLCLLFYANVAGKWEMDMVTAKVQGCIEKCKSDSSINEKHLETARNAAKIIKSGTIPEELQDWIWGNCHFQMVRQLRFDLERDPQLPDRIEDDVPRLAREACHCKCKQTSLAVVTSTPTTVDPPKSITEYLRCAGECSRNRSAITAEDHSHAISRLSQCGVVGLRDLFDPALLEQLREAWESWKTKETFSGFSMEKMRNWGSLRGDREEIWLPFTKPFSDPRLIRNPKLVRLLEAGLDVARGERAVLDYATVINSESGVAITQDIHTDVALPRSHLELHLPLADVTQAKGPTLFCPCTHSYHQKWRHFTDGHTVYQRFGLDGRCEHQPETHFNATSTFGEATLYDSSLFHKGLANRSPGDRPVLVIAFAASMREVALRNHEGDLATSFPVAHSELQKFRRHGVQSHGAHGEL